jgi:hypothetical protein
LRVEHLPTAAECVGQELRCQQFHLMRKAGTAPCALVASFARYWPTADT